MNPPLQKGIPVSTTPLAVLDLIPRSSGAGASDAVRNAIDLARQAERFGYQRYWFAEHHLNPGVLGVSPAVSIALVAGATSTIRLGSAGVQLGHRQALATVEEFGLLDAVYPGRLDLGLGRSIGRQKPAPAADQHAAAVSAYVANRGGRAHTVEQRADNGLLLPKQYDFSRLLANSATKFATLLDLLQQPGAYTPDYDSQVSDILAFLAGTYVSPNGVEVHTYPGEGAAVQVWILGASGGSSATVAGERGLRFAASYHHSPSTVIDAVDAYRAAFRPSADLDRTAHLGVRGRRRRRHRRARRRARLRLRPVGAQHPRGLRRDPVPHPEGGGRARVDRRGPRPRPGPHRHAARRVAADGRRQARTAAGRHRRARAGRHHHHPRPHRPGALLRAAGAGVDPPRPLRRQA